MKRRPALFHQHFARPLRWAWLLVWLACPLGAMAYRPFFSTDAAVADKSVLELEFGVVDFSNQHGQNTVASPSVRLNFGFAKDWEVVAEGELQVFDSVNRRDIKIIGSQLDLKGVLIEGPLQDKSSPISIAVEFSALLPDTGGRSGWGFESILIGSWRTGKYTFHVNAGGGIERKSLEPLGLWGVIVERPIAENWRIAAEVNGESARGSTANNSTLIAVLWEHRKITYDAGVRFGLSKAAPDVAITAGLSFRF